MLANNKMEPTRLTVCAIMALRRAAQAERYVAPNERTRIVTNNDEQ